MRTVQEIHTKTIGQDCNEPATFPRRFCLIVNTLIWVLGLGVPLLLIPRLLMRLQLSRAKHRSLAGHARMSRRLARLVPFYEYDEVAVLPRG